MTYKFKAGDKVWPIYETFRPQVWHVDEQRTVEAPLGYKTYELSKLEGEVRCGQHEDNLFVTQKEAQLEAKARNAEINWNDNSIQFPRLIAELQMAGGFTEEIIKLLALSMDLEIERVYEIIDRACREWDDIVAETV